MSFDKIRQYTSEVQDEIIDALKHLINQMGEGETQGNDTQWRRVRQDNKALIKLNVTYAEEELTVLAHTAFEGTGSDVVGFTLNLNDEGVMHIVDGIYEGEDFDYETLNNEYKIIECIDELCNLCKEINQQVETNEDID